MYSYVIEEKDIQVIKDILDELEFPYTIHGDELFAEKDVENILVAEGIVYRKN